MSLTLADSHSLSLIVKVSEPHPCKAVLHMGKHAFCQTLWRRAPLCPPHHNSINCHKVQPFMPHYIDLASCSGVISYPALLWLKPPARSMSQLLSHIQMSWALKCVYLGSPNPPFTAAISQPSLKIDPNSIIQEPLGKKTWINPFLESRSAFRQCHIVIENVCSTSQCLPWNEGHTFGDLLNILGWFHWKWQWQWGGVGRKFFPPPQPPNIWFLVTPLPMTFNL